MECVYINNIYSILIILQSMLYSIYTREDFCHHPREMTDKRITNDK